MPPRLIPLEGSTHRPTREAGLAPARLDPATVLQATILLRPRVPDADILAAVVAMAQQLPFERRYLSAADCERRYGATRRDLRQVAAYASACGLTVGAHHPAGLSLKVSGSVAAFSRAFGVAFRRLANDQGDCLTYDGPVHVPSHLRHVVTAILGFDTRALTDRHLPVAERFVFRPATAASVARAYHFPEGTDGRGQTIGLIALGGGFHRDDIARFFRRHRLRPPRISVVSIDGAVNEPADPEAVRAALAKVGLSNKHVAARLPFSRSVAPARNSPRGVKWTLETTGDIQTVGAFAPRAHLVVYFAHDTLRGQYDAFGAAITDARRRPTVVSCSWGRNESDVPTGFCAAIDRLFQLAALQGITLCCSSGDDGEASGPQGPEVQFPASSPHVLACGGTSLPTADAEERAWNETLLGRTMASGGGFSTVFSRPAWQRIVHAGHAAPDARAVPDVAGKADLRRGYAALVANTIVPMGGTSAAAPMWAALVARVNQGLRLRSGWLNPLLYASRFKNATRDVVRGRTSARFFACPGWNPCTGLGSPNGRMLMLALGRDRPRDV